MDQLIENLRAAVGRDAVLAEPDELLVYECDGLPQHKHRPRAVVFPSSTEETAAVMCVLAKSAVPFTPRGAGTGLSGGALALEQGVVIELARMREILRIDEANRLAVVQTGVINAHVSRAVASHGLHYVPDPSSQPTCTIGGNIAENAGGIHCLKYGTTTDHVLSARVVLAGGNVVDLGSAGGEFPGYDLLGVFIGSEGTFGIATEATLRLVPIPPTVRTLLAEFAEVNDASHAVSAIIAAGVMPAALEMMDREIIRAVEASVFAAGLPPDAGAALLIELDGIEAGIDDEAERVKDICLHHGARDCRAARDENERKKLWAARKGAFGAIGRISPDSMIQDAVVPRSRLPQVLANAYQIAAKYQLRIANVFHAGDGNLHPLICFDSRFPEEVQRVKEAGRELMETCVRAGGSITGEHGVGLDKRDLLSLIFSDDDMDTMLRVRAAFDPSGLCNPGKIVPVLKGCGEARAVGAAVLGVQASRQQQGVLGAQASRLQQRGAASLNEIEDAPERQNPSARTSGKAAGSDPDTALRCLAGIVGNENITRSQSSVVFLSGVLTVAPGSIAETCEVMKLAFTEGWSVVPAGSGTWFDAGNSLKDIMIILSTRRLNRVLEHEPADLVAVTESGATLRDFNVELSRNGQWLPLDPPDDGRATIGGVVATGIGGAQQYGYGPPRSFVIGMRVVLADGRLIKVGGRVVKNVAGYDLSKLFTGSYGTLGVIVEINFKLRPRPQREITLVASGADRSLWGAANSILNASLFPVALELLSSSMGKAIGIEANNNDSVLLIRFAGNNKAVAYQAEQTLILLHRQNDVRTSGTRSDDANLWQTLAALPLEEDNQLTWRATVTPADSLRFINDVSISYGDAFPTLLWQTGIANGRVRVIERSPVGPDWQVRLLGKLRSQVQALGGSLVLENARAEVKQSFDAWGTAEAPRRLMKRIKQQLDPQGILSPGRFNFEAKNDQSKTHRKGTENTEILHREASRTGQ